MRIEIIDFQTILPYWQQFLWPNRKSEINPISTIKYMGGYDMNIKNNTPTFWAIFDDKKIVGVNSGVKTSIDGYRSRGIYILGDYRGKNLSNLLFSELEKQAKIEQCSYIWSMPRKGSHYSYLKYGFVQTSDFFDEGVEFGPNCYVKKDIL